MIRKLLLGAALLGIGSANGNAGIPLGTEPAVLSDDGGWCWFESPRIVLQGQRLIVGSVAGGAGGAERRGDIEAVAYDLQTRTASVVQLRDKLGFGDHDSPAILPRPDGRPVAVNSVQMDSAGLPVSQGGDDLRYRYARWDGKAWKDYPLAFAGTRLYSGEDDYSGLVAIDPFDPDTVYLSTNADPETGEPLVSAADGLRHWEIFRGVTSDSGASWMFTPITENSTADNFRPIMPSTGDGGRRALVWLRGKYKAYTDFRQQVVALVWRN